MDFSLTGIDWLFFAGFLVLVVTVGTLQGRNERDSTSYFLAGRGLSWWLIGISLIAANISTEQYVGMTGSAAGPLGLAIASYCWIASFGLVIVAFVFLPAFLRTGVYTIPEFLEHRYHPFARAVMALSTVVIYALVTIAAVTYSGALTMATLFEGRTILSMPINVTTGGWIIGLIAALYVAAGGLKACAWADLLQGTALIAGGLIIVWLAFDKLGATPLAELTACGPVSPDLADDASGVAKFLALNQSKLHMILPRDNPDLPWTALVVGLWIPNFYYWGLNQFIVQRTLGSKSLAAGQKGVVMAGALELILPLCVVVPGIIAFNLFSADMTRAAAQDPKIVTANAAVLQWYEQVRGDIESQTVFAMDAGWIKANPDKAVEIDSHNRAVLAAAGQNEGVIVTKTLLGYKYDTAFALLIRKLIPPGVRGFILAAILGAVISSLAAMLNSASTIFTMDIYRKYIAKAPSQSALVWVGRGAVVVFMVIGCIVSPLLGHPKFGGVFRFIQEFQGYISPGILAVFVFGLIVRRAPAASGVVGLIVNPVFYGVLSACAPGIAFLDRMAISFAGVIVVMSLVTLTKPLAQPVVMPVNETIDLTPSRGAQVAGVLVAIVAVTLYLVFW